MTEEDFSKMLGDQRHLGNWSTIKLLDEIKSRVGTGKKVTNDLVLELIERYDFAIHNPICKKCIQEKPEMCLF